MNWTQLINNFNGTITTTILELQVRNGQTCTCLEKDEYKENYKY